MDEQKITLGLEDSKDLAAGDIAGLCNTMRVSEKVSNHGRGHALLGHFADVVCDLQRGPTRSKGLTQPEKTPEHSRLSRLRRTS